MRSSKGTNFDDYIDFCGGYHLDFKDMDLSLTEEFMAGLIKNLTFTELVEIFANDLDQLAYSAVYALSNGDLTRAQAATFLEYRSMKNDFDNVSVIDIFNGDNETIVDRKMMRHFTLTKDDEFITQLRERPRFESCFFSIKINESRLSNIRLYGFLQLAHDYSIIKMTRLPLAQIRTFPEVGTIDEINRLSSISVIVGSACVRDTLTTVIYSEHAKHLFHRLGIFDIDTMQQSVINHGRYAAIDYPSIPPATSFHQLTESSTFMTLHDELHRRLISSIYNPIYDCLLHSITLVRTKTGMHWSREIWDSIDMEVSEFLDDDIETHISKLVKYKSYTPSTKEKTLDFAKLLQAKIHTQDRSIGLFTPSPFIDTAWLLLIDMVVNKTEWDKLNIDFSTLDAKQSAFAILYKFTLKHKEKLINEASPAKQIAIIKSLWFDLPYDPSLEAMFVKMEHPKYIQIYVNDQPLVSDKNKFLAFQKSFTYQSVAHLMVDIEEGHIDKHTAIAFITHEPMAFSNLYMNTTDLINLTNQFPSYKDILLKPIMIDTSQLDRLARTVMDYSKLIEHYPDYKNLFIEHLEHKIKGQDTNDISLLNDKKFIFDLNDFILLTQLLPKHKDAFITSIFSNQAQFQRLISDDTWLKKAINAFPEHETEFTQLGRVLIPSRMKHLQLNSSKLFRSQHTINMEARLNAQNMQEYIDKGYTTHDDLLDIQDEKPWLITALNTPIIRHNIYKGTIQIEQLHQLSETQVESIKYATDEKILIEAIKEYIGNSKKLL